MSVESVGGALARLLASVVPFNLKTPVASCRAMLATSCALRLDKCEARSMSSCSADVRFASSVTRWRGNEDSIARLRSASADEAPPLPTREVSALRSAGERAGESVVATPPPGGERRRSEGSRRVERRTGLGSSASAAGELADIPSSAALPRRLLKCIRLDPSRAPGPGLDEAGCGCMARSFCRRFWNQTCTDFGVIPSCMANDWRTGADGCPPCRSKALWSTTSIEGVMHVRAFFISAGSAISDGVNQPVPAL
mmetsp:Transcript_14137/g.38393  ORF Transcript_14137/g.38393 Transcript_14137/m.38393 type:complete len:254 (-) Transcript_14137:3-764(-)